MDVFETKITCPHCQHSELLEVPIENCLQHYECAGCKLTLISKTTECCVLTSFASTPKKICRDAVVIAHPKRRISSR